jgi:hypothetical protein
LGAIYPTPRARARVTIVTRETLFIAKARDLLARYFCDIGIS